MITFAQHQLGMGNVQLVVKGSASGVLHAVVGPQDLCAVANIDGLKVLLPMRGRKRLMTRAGANPASVPRVEILSPAY